MRIRTATVEDANIMSVILADIINIWESDRPSDAEHVREFYIEDASRIQCVVAICDDGKVLGFQSLKLAEQGNCYGVTPGWGIIGTYVRSDIGRRGIGSALFAMTAQAARQAGLPKIDATIGENNMAGLGYYDSMGFRTYCKRPDVICKCYTVTDNSD